MFNASIVIVGVIPLNSALIEMHIDVSMVMFCEFVVVVVVVAVVVVVVGVAF